MYALDRTSLISVREVPLTAVKQTIDTETFAIAYTGTRSDAHEIYADCVDVWKTDNETYMKVKRDTIMFHPYRGVSNISAGLYQIFTPKAYKGFSNG